MKRQHCRSMRSMARAGSSNRDEWLSLASTRMYRPLSPVVEKTALIAFSASTIAANDDRITASADWQAATSWATVVLRARSVDGSTLRVLTLDAAHYATVDELDDCLERFLHVIADYLPVDAFRRVVMKADAHCGA
jgi:hypothetical protein